MTRPAQSALGHIVPALREETPELRRAYRHDSAPCEETQELHGAIQECDTALCEETTELRGALLRDLHMPLGTDLVTLGADPRTAPPTTVSPASNSRVDFGSSGCDSRRDVCASQTCACIDRDYWAHACFTCDQTAELDIAHAIQLL